MSKELPAGVTMAEGRGGRSSIAQAFAKPLDIIGHEERRRGNLKERSDIS